MFKTKSLIRCIKEKGTFGIKFCSITLLPLSESYFDWSVWYRHKSSGATQLRSDLLHLELLHQLHCRHVQLQFGKPLPNAGPEDI